MHSRTQTAPTRRGLLAVVGVALLLVFVVTNLGGEHRGVQCASLPLAASESGSEHAPAVLRESHTVLSRAPHETAPAQAPEPTAPPTPTVPPPDPGPGTPVRGSVVDKRASEPVPFVTVEVRGGGRRERVEADPTGAFVTTQNFQTDALEIEVVDGKASYGVTKLDWDPPLDQAPAIAVEIGPTFLVRDIGTRPPAPDDDWLLRIVQTPRSLESAGEIGVRNQELVMPEETENVWAEVELRFSTPADSNRAAPEAFARWQRARPDAAPGFHARLLVRSMRRCERGAIEIKRTFGLQTLPAVETTRFLLLSGLVGTGARNEAGPVRVLVRPAGDSTEKSASAPPDFQETQVGTGGFEVELRAHQTYSVLAWSGGGEPTLVERALDRSGRHQLRDALIGLLQYPSFDPKEVAAEYGRIDRRGHQLVRARVQGGGPYALAIVDSWDVFGTARAANMLETRYDIESIGLDTSPATFGVSWTQILPGPLVPDRLGSGAVPIEHRIEWVDHAQGIARTDALVTGGPGGVVVTQQETGLKATWTVVPKAPLRFTVWKDGFEPVGVSTEDFVDRGDERVASVALRTGWGVALTFVVIDAEKGALGVSDWSDKSRERGARKTFSQYLDFLGLPPLPRVDVTSPQAHGTSDADGCVLLHATTWPDRLSLSAPGYRLRELRRLQGGGARWIAYMEHDRYDL